MLTLNHKGQMNCCQKDSKTQGHKGLAEPSTQVHHNSNQRRTSDSLLLVAVLWRSHTILNYKAQDQKYL